MDVIHWMSWDSSDEELWNNPTFWITLILAVGYGMWNIYDSTINILVQLHHSPALLSFPCNCLPAVPLTFWLNSGWTDPPRWLIWCPKYAQVCEDSLKVGAEKRHNTSLNGRCLSILLCSADAWCTGCTGSHTKATGVSLHPLSTMTHSLIHHAFLIFFSVADPTKNIRMNFCPD